MKNVAVIGAGTMGHGLALVHALGGCNVKLFDIDATVLERARSLMQAACNTLERGGVHARGELDAALARIVDVNDLASAVGDADLIVEAVVEKPEIKRAVYAEIGAAAPAAAIVASNTSYLDVFPLLPDNLKTRTLIAHWYTPPYIVDLVDIAPGPDTDPAHVETLRALYAGFDKAPLVFEKLIQGYIANRLQSALNLECLRMIDEGWVKAEDIDFSIRHGLVERLAVLGHMRKADYTGIEMMRNALASRAYTPPPQNGRSDTVDRLIAEGRTGVRAGAGFYDYGGKSAEELFELRDVKLLKMKKAIQEIVEE